MLPVACDIYIYTFSCYYRRMRSYNRLGWGRGCYSPFNHLPLSSMMIQSLKKCERRLFIMSFASLIKVVDISLGGGLQNNDQLVKGSGTARGGGEMGQGYVNMFVIYRHVIYVLV